MDDKNQIIHNINNATAYLKMCIAELRDHGVDTKFIVYDAQGQRAGEGKRCDLLFSETTGK